jgi:hypothetical protein
MSEPQSVPHFMDQHAADVGDSPTIGSELQRTAIGIEGLMIVKQNIGFHDRSAGITIVGYSQGTRTEGLPEDRA